MDERAKTCSPFPIIPMQEGEEREERRTLHYSAFMWDGWYDIVPPLLLSRFLPPSPLPLANAHMVDDIILYHAPPE